MNQNLTNVIVTMGKRVPNSIDLKKYVDYKLPSLYQTQIHLTKYSRWNEELNRRETWPETVYRYIDFEIKQAQKHGLEIDEQTQTELFEAILNLEVMPSMRCMMTAGRALERDNAAGYNCSYLHINRVQAFDEAMYLLMCGTGVGFSVERQFINDLPDLPTALFPTETTIVVADSRIGWATSLRQLLSMLFSGVTPKWDLRKVRPSGSALKTFGGRASGPEPLNDLFKFAVNLFQSAISQGQRKLNSIQCHSLMCKIGDVVVSGGVRRSALISLSNPSDDRMRNAKSGQWWETNPHFALANNSAAWTEKPDSEIFLEEWLSLVKSKSGERGIFNREAAKRAAAKSGRRDTNFEFGCNPCSEIILRDRQFCNLSEVVVRSTDTLQSLKRKVRLATILGTLQSTLTDFRYLSSAWKTNTEEERLLGVSLTGIMDHLVLNGKVAPNAKNGFNINEQWYKNQLTDVLQYLKSIAININKEWATKLNIEQSTAVTCVKPSGTVSQLVDAASGIHPRHAKYYLRTNRANKIDPMAHLMKDQGIPCEDDVMKPDVGVVFSFPQKAPEGAIYRNNLSAIEHLNLWLTYQEYWCEHKPSVTISVRDNEWIEVGAFVYKHFELMSGVSFLPFSDHSYRQAPYQDLTEDEYLEWMSKMPQEVNWHLTDYEKTDTTTSTREFACTGPQGCELDLGQ